jgi:hypothetical protein
MRILGVDAPRGWAVLDVPVIGQSTVLACGTLDAGRETDELAEMITKWSPMRVTIEAPLEAYIGGRVGWRKDTTAAGAYRDQNVKRYLQTNVSNWPKQSNVDERDAAAACIYAARVSV